MNPGTIFEPITRVAKLLAAVSALFAPGASLLADSAEQRFEFTRMMVHWKEYDHPGYLKFIEDAEPEVVQVGFYGGAFWSAAHLPQSAAGASGALLPNHAGAFEADTPAARLKGNLDYFRKLNEQIHQRGAKVVGHFAMGKYLLGEAPDDPLQPKGGFFEFYHQLWDEKELGPKPIDDPVELLQRRADGTPVSSGDVDAQGYRVYYGCPNSPYWRAVMKALAKHGIKRGVDGFQINYFYRFNCLCRHCVSGFRSTLKSRYTAGELRSRFGIEDIETHEFKVILGRYGLGESTPLRREMRRFSDISNKKAFDEVFIDYGRSIKPGLIVSQWLHSATDFSYPPRNPNDERMMLPSELWGKGEDYLWYCLGDNEATLQLHYLRGAFADKPYTVCHYERVKIRATMAELMANGGTPMAHYMDFTEPATRREIVRYFQFVKRYNEVYRASRMYGEVLLLHPRSEIHKGNYGPAMTTFNEMGQSLIDHHVLFDIVPDEIVTPEQRARYRSVHSVASPSTLSKKTFDGLSRFKAPDTIRVSASRPASGQELTIHFVNYDRDEDTNDESLQGAAREQPRPVADIQCDVALPKGLRVKKIEMITPEADSAVDVVYEVYERNGLRVRFTVPEFLVYTALRIRG